MVKINRASLTAVCLILLIAGFSGCGRKGPPVAPGAPALSPVAGFSYEIADGFVKLSWDEPAGQDKDIITGYIVQRSIEAAETESCEGCPVLFQRAAKLEKNRFSYGELIETGNRYIYKVVSVSKYGNLSPDSILIKFSY